MSSPFRQACATGTIHQVACGGLFADYKKQGSTFPSIHPSIADSSKAEKLGIIAGPLRNWHEVTGHAPSSVEEQDWVRHGCCCKALHLALEGNSLAERKRSHMLRSVKCKVDISYGPPTLKWAGVVEQNSNNRKKKSLQK